MREAMKVTEKKIEWVRQSYWEEFHKTYPDSSGFRLFVASDPTLIKIFNFCSVPSIWDGVRKFPFDDKIKELESISDNEKKYLREAYWKEKDKRKREWIEYLSNMFDMVCSTVMLKKKLDSDNVQLKQAYNLDQIFEMVEYSFQNYISVNERITSTNSAHIWRIGTWYPQHIMVVYKKGANVQAMIFHYFFQPDNIEASFDWDVYSVRIYLKHQFDDLFDSNTRKFTIQHYYEGKPLLDKPFIFQIAKRYAPLLNASAKKMIKMGLFEDFDSAFAEANSAIFEAVKKYDDSRGPFPNYLNLHLKIYHPGNLFDNLSTEAGDIPCNDFCKNEKASTKELPCIFETEAGFCKNPKKKRKLKSKIEIRESDLDESIDLEGAGSKDRLESQLTGDKKRNKRHFFDMPDDKSYIDPKNEAALIRMSQDERLKGILEKLHTGINLIDLREKDRQYYYRYIKKQKETMNKS